MHATLGAGASRRGFSALPRESRIESIVGHAVRPGRLDEAPFKQPRFPAHLIVTVPDGEGLRLDGDVSLWADECMRPAKRGLLGNAHDDTLLGGEVEDVLVGRSARDLRMRGVCSHGPARRIESESLLAGATQIDAIEAAIHGILLEWTSNRGWTERS